MSDDVQQLQKQRRKNCCRLCLAPDNECISIMHSYAADKEPLTTKISSCVSIKVSSNDLLSLRICHACISYLNSWQSFKNRCLTAQNKQRSWLADAGGAASSSGATQKSHDQTDHHHQYDDSQHNDEHGAAAATSSSSALSSSILEGISTLKKRKSLTVYVSPKEKVKQQHQQQQLKQQLAMTATASTTAANKLQHLQLYQTTNISNSATNNTTTTTTTTTTSVTPNPSPTPNARISSNTAAAANIINVSPAPKRQYIRHKHSSQKTLNMQQQMMQIAASTATTSTVTTVTASSTTTGSIAYSGGGGRSKSKYKREKRELHLQQQLLSLQQSFAAIAPPPPCTAITPCSTATVTSTTTCLSSIVTTSNPSVLSTAGNILTTSAFNTDLFAGMGLDVGIPTGTVSFGDVSGEVGVGSSATGNIATLDFMGSGTSGGAGDGADVGGICASSIVDAYTAEESSSAVCSSAVQQLRLFRRYSYNHPLPAVQIKDEPYDDADDLDYRIHKESDECDDMVDPTMFLERTADEGDDALMDSNAYDYENDAAAMELNKSLPAGTSIRMNPPANKEAACRACNLKFSTRANARRHEKNLHPNLFESLEEKDSSLNKQTAALNASLELQRAVAAAVAADACKLTSSGVITPQKYRQEVVNAFNNSEIVYDYNSPEKYQHLLTDEKIVFLQQNDEFLRQYQNMTCRCCSKYYVTYKNFMAHMRKKYLGLPRNCCFNCLKLNDSKALFISHLKKRNCINLHRVLQNLMARNANFAAAVTATVAAAPEKLKARELLVNKMYECKLCPKTFRLKLEFRSHVYEEHADVQRKDLNANQCSFCAVDIEDPAERKRHYNNMDCIVTLRCVTCDTKHEGQNKFNDHVQEIHLANFNEFLFESAQPVMRALVMPPDTSRNTNYNNISLINTSQPRSQYFSRMPQICPICGQQYNNYNNVLRHMESKHPDQLPQTYKCVKCGLGYPRLSNLREHMVGVHAADQARHTGFEYIVNADAVKNAANNRSSSIPQNQQYTGRYDYVMKDLMSITNGGSFADDEEYGGDENATKKMRLDANANNTQITQTAKECPICQSVFANNIGLSNHMRSHQSILTNNAGGFSSSVTSPKPPPAVSDLTGPQALLKKSLEQVADKRFRRMRCRICQRRFSSKKSYRYHMLNDHQIRNVQFIKCKLCDAEFAYEKGLKVHMFKIHNTLLKDHMIIKQYECEICSIVYRTDVELQHHLANVHHHKSGQGNNDGEAYDADESTAGVAADNQSMNTGDMSGISTPVSTIGANDNNSAAGAVTAAAAATVGPLYWYQCKYCPSNFNTNKKLAIHINSHDEFDSNDYSCKDCGNVYSGRKSLWVHRYKKHPQVPDPSECHMCKKVFFDNPMLENHIPTCNRKPITTNNNDGTGGAAVQQQQFYKHKTGDDDEEDVAGGGGNDSRDAANLLQSSSSGKIKLPEVACTICGARFTDQDLFAKHIQKHEMELYTDNPLAAMFDTGPADPNQFFVDRMNDNGEYACDLCAKTFTQITALKLHRKWHFRGDNKQQNEADQHTANSHSSSNNNNHNHKSTNNHQHPLGLQAVGLVPREYAPQQPQKAQKRKRELKCQYCPSTFISNNNLRRHLYELHKNEMGNLPEPPRIDCDLGNSCRRCNLKFESKAEWIEHKVGEARVMKPFGPFQWGCDLCGAYVSRKEKLINHLYNHMKEQVIVPVEHPETQRTQQQKEDYSPTMETSSGFKKIKLPLRSPIHQVQQQDEESHDSAAKFDYDEVEDDDEEDVEEEEEQGGANNEHEPTIPKTEAAAYEEVDSDDMEDEEFDDMAVGAQQTVGAAGEDEEQQQQEYEEELDDDDEDDDDDDDMDEVADDEYSNEASSKLAIASQQQQHNIPNTNKNAAAVDSDDNSEEFDDDDDEDDDDDDDDDDDASSTENRKPSSALLAKAVVKSRFSCDLCQLFFDTQLELQKHVKMHFLNGPGSVTLTEINRNKSSSSKSRSSSSDVVTVNSS